MAEQPYEAIHIDEVPEPTYEKKPGDTDWRPLRIHFGIRSFGVNADYSAGHPRAETRLATRYAPATTVDAAAAVFSVTRELDPRVHLSS